MNDGTDGLQSRGSVIPSLLAAAAVFAIDAVTANQVAVPTAYVLSVCLAFLTQKRAWVWRSAAACSGLTVLGLFLGPPAAELEPVLANRGIALLMIWLTAILCARNLWLLSRHKERARVFREGEDRLRATLSSIGEGVITTDPAGLVTSLNRTAESFTGWTNEEAIGRPLPSIFRVVDEQTRHAVEDPVQNALRKGAVVATNAVLIAKDETERPTDASAAPVREENGQVTGCILVFRDVTHRKQEEAQLRKAEHFQRLALEAGGLAYWEWDIPTRRVTWGPGAHRMYGLDSTDTTVEGDIVVQRIHEEDREHVRRKAYEAVELDKPYETEFRVVWPDGSVHWLMARASVTERDATGKALRMVGVRMDITERKRVEQELRESEQRFRMMANTAPALLWITDEQHQCTFISAEWRSFTGQTEAEALGLGWIEAIHPEDRDRTMEECSEATDRRAPFRIEYRLLRSDGEYRWALNAGVPRYSEGGAFLGYIGSIIDVHERKRTEQSSRFLADASAALAKIVDYESTLTKIAGIAVPEFADWSAVDLLSDEQTLRRVSVRHTDPDKVRLAQQLSRRYPPGLNPEYGVGQVIATGQPAIVPDISDEMVARAAQDEQHLELIRQLGLKSYLCVPLTLRGQTIGAITFVMAESGRRFDERDLSVARDLASRAAIAVDNAELYQALRDADRRKDDFLATLAHELRNPLAPLRSGLDLMKLAGDDAKVLRASLGIMERQTSILIALVDDLLDVSRINRGKFELKKKRIQLNDVIQAAVEASQPLMYAARQEFSLSVPDHPVALEADPHRLAQIITNLLNNAAKYTPEAGRISLTVEARNEELVLSVKDSGIGILPEMRERIFEMFEQIIHPAANGSPGLGLGLTVVKSLVQLHGGSVAVFSEGLNKGSEFLLRLPVVVVPAPPEAQPASREQDGDSVKRRVLIVDDSVDAVQTLKLFVDLLGHDVRTASDGEGAVAAAAEFLPDVVFLDLGMPGMDGYEAARRIRQQPWGRDIILIALSGWGQPEDRQRTKAAGFDHHLVKPASSADLQKLIDAGGNVSGSSKGADPARFDQ